MTDKYFALYWCLCVSLSIFRFIKWSEMDPNVKPQISVDTFDHDNAQFYSGDICSSHKVVDLSYFNMHN